MPNTFGVQTPRKGPTGGDYSPISGEKSIKRPSGFSSPTGHDPTSEWH